MAALPPLLFNQLGDICINNRLPDSLPKCLVLYSQLLVGVEYTSKAPNLPSGTRLDACLYHNTPKSENAFKTHFGAKNGISD